MKSWVTTKPPLRTPLAVVEALRPYIENKFVCDVGCREGDLMIEMQKYANRVIGVDTEQENVDICTAKGLDVFKLDALTDKLPEADVYYVWIWKDVNEKVCSLIPKGTVILGGDQSIGEIYYVRDAELIRVPYNEGDGDRESGTFTLTIVEKGA